LKIESINQGFSKESTPVIAEWLKKQYEDWFYEAAVVMVSSCVVLMVITLVVSYRWWRKISKKTE